MKVIITGATGMVGEGVLHECVLSKKISSILVIGRRPCGYEHSNVQEILIIDFMNSISSIP
jgi:malate/lactate dehydrogenase